MDVRTWPEQDEEWASRYRTAIAGRHVPPAALEAREHELLDAVRAAGLPAAELFGDAATLAAEDAAELATEEESVRTSEGGGLRSALREIGGSLTGIAAVTVLIMVVRNGWSVDVDVDEALVVASIAAVALAWVVARALFTAGRPVAVVAVLGAAVAVAAAGIAWATTLPADAVAASDVPVLALGLVLLAPGVVALVVAGRMPPQVLREDWDDDAWLRRFRGGLRTRLVPAATARGHVVEVEQTVRAGSASAVEEFGHPLVLARQLAQADRTARARRWWLSTVAGTVVPLLIATSVLGLGRWGALTVPVVALLLLSALGTLAVGWGSRPWADRR